MQVQSLGWEDPREEGIPTPVFLAGESHGQRSLASYRPWGCAPIQLKQLSTHACKGPLR